jgi:RecA-family ATPase
MSEREWMNKKAAQLEAAEGIFEEVDWQTLFTETPEGVDWLVEPMIERGSLVALFSPPKEGKSLLALEIAAALATGRPVLSRPAGEPVHVLYVDFENSRKDLVDRLRAFNYQPAELKALHYLWFPTMQTLDTQEGGEQLYRNAAHYEAEVVIIDTVSRVVEGGENDNDTFKDMYRHSLSPLKRDGITVIRLDHTGKNVEAGQRGASAKNADVDVVWRLALKAKNSPRVRLVREFSRQPNCPDEIHLTRVNDPYLRHETDRLIEMEEGMAHSADMDLTDAVDPRVEALARDLDRWGVPVDMGRTQIRKQYKEIKGNDRLFAPAQELRRTGG